MPFMKHQGKGGNFSHAGVQYKVGAHGLIDIPDHVVETAKVFGFQKADTPPAGPVELTPVMVGSMTRAELFEYCDTNDIDIPSGTKIAQVRQIVMEHADEAYDEAQAAVREKSAGEMGEKQEEKKDSAEA